MGIRAIVFSVCSLYFFMGQLLADPVKPIRPRLKLNQAINQLVDACGENLNIGIKIVSLHDKKILYEVNNDRLFVPASSMKLFTAAAALLYLEPNFTFRTQIFTDAPIIQKASLKGDLFIKFSGDPELKSKQLDQLFAKLKEEGIKKIEGNVYLDFSHYDQETYGKGWMWDDLEECYSAPIHAAILDRNCVRFRLTPSKKNGGLAKLDTYNMNSFSPVINRVKTKQVKRGCYPSIQLMEDNTFEATGCIRKQSKPVFYSMAIRSPEFYAQQTVAGLLAKNGIELQGELKTGLASEKLQLLVEHKSRPLPLLLKRMLKESDNLISESLLKQLGARYYGSRGTWKRGVKAVKAILRTKLKVDFSNTTIADGSGASRYNLVTPDVLIELLSALYRHPKFSTEFIRLLAVSGKDGTLENRMGEKALIGRVKAKTGSMKGVTSLSGYIQTTGKKTIAFVIVINGFSEPMYKYKRLEDNICKLLVNAR